MFTSINTQNFFVAVVHDAQRILRLFHFHHVRWKSFDYITLLREKFNTSNKKLSKYSNKT